MVKRLPDSEEIPPELNEIIQISERLLGKVIKDSVGARLYQRMNAVQKKMPGLQGKAKKARTVLKQTLSQFEGMSVLDRRSLARAYTLRLELINSCENAYRSHRLALHMQEQQSREKSFTTTKKFAQRPNVIIYVLTAHPTEARAPQNIAVFHLIQRQLIAALDRKQSAKDVEMKLYHLLQLAWRTSIVRNRSPEVGDEAEHIYSTLLEKSILDSLLDVSREVIPVYVRSWVGGDKDGHPGVNEKVMQKSLSLSRSHLITYVQAQLDEVLCVLALLGIKPLQAEISRLSRSLPTFRKVLDGDGFRLTNLRRNLNRIFKKYEEKFGSLHPNLGQLQRLIHMFPALVVPLELRESSDILMSDQTNHSRLAIDRMLGTLAKLAKGGDPRWYARGFVISMASSLEHLQVAERKVRRAFGSAKIPVIPLFEQGEALKQAPKIVQQWLEDSRLGRDVRKDWGGQCEMMVGYSDSSKERGVLCSRLEIAEAMFKLEQVCLKKQIKPIFFQGSGGSVDRGGGTIQDQTAWWPHSALKTYKVTIQGEMVERSLASPEITRGQIERIAESASETLAHPSRPPHLSAIRDFAMGVASAYQNQIHDLDFLKLVEKATPYLALRELRIGSRPVRRANRQSQLSVEGLRAIPWVLCWTQTRILFPTWWGIGSNWKKSNPNTKKALRRAFAEEPVFASYIRALGFTLAKVELDVWRIYLERSGLDPKLIQQFYRSFEMEFAGALKMVRFISGEKDPLWFRRWLGTSIRLRSPMIHPLNLLQIVALEKKDATLLRLTVTGISSGMLTTG